MNASILELCAYHESGRVVFAYMAGYFATSIQLNQHDYGSGTSILNPGYEGEDVSKLLKGLSPSAFEQPAAAYNVAAKLLIIFCAGTCARVFYLNGGKVDEETELEFPGQDSLYIDRLQAFMSTHNPNHPEDYLERTVRGIFVRLAKPEIWKSISALANASIRHHDKPLNRYTIEDELLGSGMKLKRATITPSIDLGLSEGDEEPSVDAPIESKQQGINIDDVSNMLNETPLDIVLKNYLIKIRPDWKDLDVEKGKILLKEIFKKYGS